MVSCLYSWYGFFFYRYGDHRDLHSFPTRRSSDLAVSVGIVEGQAVCDLEYIEDSNADTDMNVIMTDDGRIIEVQGTAEGEPFSHDELLQLLELAKNGIATIIDAQRQALKD